MTFSRTGALLTLMLVLAIALGAQAPSKVTWTARTTAGTTTGFAVGGNDQHTVQAIVTGSPSSCTIHLDGSLDGIHYFDLSGDFDCTSDKMFHVVNRAVLVVRANISALSGGTSPTVTVSYLGQRTGGRQ